MASEAFYTTAAQVLPTLLIALSIEIGVISRPYAEAAKAAQALAEQVRQQGIPSVWTPEQLRTLQAGADGRAYGRSALWVRWAFLFGLVFLAGETAARLAVGYHWFNPWTFYTTGASAVLLMLATAIIPWLRLSSDLFPE
ncbi:hypothetical protein ACNF49_30305 [Actinomadura sp. ATCC 39365]